MSMAKQLRNEEGFTLLEVVVVICIFIVIAGFSIVSWGPAQTKAYNAQALNDVKNTETACQSCCLDGCKTCTLVEDTTDPDNWDKKVQCGDCPDGVSITRYTLSSFDLQMTLDNEPLVCKNTELIGAYHPQGDKIFCLHESTADLDTYSFDPSMPLPDPSTMCPTLL